MEGMEGRVQSIRRESKPVSPRPNGRESAAPGEAELVRRLKDGEKTACEVLVATQGARMLALARGFVRDPRAAEEAVLDAFRTAFGSMTLFPSGTTLSSWLRRIQIQTCIGKLRASRELEKPIEPFLPRFHEDGHQATPASPWRPSLSTDGDRRKVLLQVQNCLAELPDSYRAVLLLRDIEGVSREEAASWLGWSEAEVERRLHRARQALRTLLAPHLARSRCNEALG